MPVPDFHTYSELIYSLQERYSSIQRSTLVLATLGPTLAKLEGQITFEGDVVLDVWELIDFETGRIRIILACLVEIAPLPELRQWANASP